MVLRTRILYINMITSASLRVHTCVVLVLCVGAVKSLVDEVHCTYKCFGTLSRRTDLYCKGWHPHSLLEEASGPSSYTSFQWVSIALSQFRTLGMYFWECHIIWSMRQRCRSGLEDPQTTGFCGKLRKVVTSKGKAPGVMCAAAAWKGPTETIITIELCFTAC